MRMMTRHTMKPDLCGEGVERRVILAQQEEMGMPAAVSLSHKLIERFRPRYLIMPGIAAGIGAEQIFGDVIVADTVWNYSYGKFVSAGEAGIKFGKVGFLPRPTRLFLSEDVAGHIREAVRFAGK